MKNFVYYIILILGFSSCSNDSIFDKNIFIKNRSWTYDQKPVYEVHVKDSASSYDLFLNLRHTNDYDFSNLYLLVQEKSLKTIDSTYRIDIKLATLDGKWLGKSAGSLYEIEHLIKENYVFPDTGIYTFTLSQNMRVNPLKDIVDVGLKVVKK